MNLRILALDLGGTTGWAISSEGAPPAASGTWGLGLKAGESTGMKFIRLRGALNDLLKAYPDIAIVYYERGLAKYQGPTLLLGGYAATLMAWCEDNRIEYRPVAITSLKKFATGKGNASKDRMIEAAMKKGWTPEDDNEADALWLLEYAKREVVA